MQVRAHAVELYKFHPDVFITSESRLSQEACFYYFWNKTIHSEQEVALEIIIWRLHLENFSLQEHLQAPGFDQEAEILLCLRDNSWPGIKACFLCNQG